MAWFGGGGPEADSGGPRGPPPGSGGTVDLVVKRVVIDLRLGSWVVGTEKHGPAQPGPLCELCSEQFGNDYLYGAMTNARCWCDFIRLAVHPITDTRAARPIFEISRIWF